MRTPDEIKKALECCFHDSEQCADCPYYPVSCDRELVRDAREYIRQLEEQLAEVCELTEFFRDKAVQLEERNKSLRENNDNLLALDGELHRDMLEQRERADNLETERDAAVEDMTKIVQECGEPYCEYCGADFKPNCTGRCWTHNEGFVWRGVLKED